MSAIFGKKISRELTSTGPRSPCRSAPYTLVTTAQLLVAFDLESLCDLPDKEQLRDAGLVPPVSDDDNDLSEIFFMAQFVFQT